jgi:hypothetical protein
MNNHRDSRRRHRPGGAALALAIERGEWERIALHTFVSIVQALRVEPSATIDDLLALLEPPKGQRDDD